MTAENAGKSKGHTLYATFEEMNNMFNSFVTSFKGSGKNVLCQTMDRGFTAGYDYNQNIGLLLSVGSFMCDKYVSSADSVYTAEYNDE